VTLHGVVSPEPPRQRQNAPVRVAAALPQSLDLASCAAELAPVAAEWLMNQTGREAGAGPGKEMKAKPFASPARSSLPDSPFRIRGAGCRVQGLGSRVQCSGFRVQGLESRVGGAGSRVQGSELRSFPAFFPSPLTPRAKGG